MPFLTTYSAVNYAYFAMTMSFDIQKSQQALNGDKLNTTSYGATSQTDSASAFSLLNDTQSMDNLSETHPNDERDYVEDGNYNKSSNS